MILVDTSVWIAHLRESDADLQTLLLGDEVLCHPFVMGEIAVGSIRDRDVVLGRLNRLTKAIVARDEEVLHFIAHHRLLGLGFGYVDAHLLAAVRLTPGALLWTRDKRLYRAAARLNVAFGAAPESFD